MTPRPLVLIALWLAAACGSGTMRPADEPGPSPEPAPSPPVEPTPAPQPEPTPGEAPPSPAPSGGQIEMRRIGQWSNTGIAESRRLVIRDKDAWASFWSQLGVGDRPEVDFNRNVVVAVAMGQRSSGGYDIAVKGVSEVAGELTVDVVETSPEPTCATTQALTQPVDVVVVVGAAGARSWNFREERQTREC
jgi:PrcB C-terminal